MGNYLFLEVLSQYINVKGKVLAEPDYREPVLNSLVTSEKVLSYEIHRKDRKQYVPTITD